MIRDLMPTLDDFPQDQANCATCTRKGGACARTGKSTPNGLLRNPCTGEISGMIIYCPNYTGPYTR